MVVEGSMLSLGLFSGLACSLTCSRVSESKCLEVHTKPHEPYIDGQNMYHQLSDLGLMHVLANTWT